MKESKNIRMASFNVGDEIRQLIKDNKHINWSAIVRKAVVDRVNLEKQINSISKNC